jgi:tetratricopeptide (TPR) repeat protein
MSPSDERGPRSAAAPGGAAPAAGARRRLSRWSWTLIVLGAAAWVWRVLYLGRLGASPLGGSLTEDAAIYWRWSNALLAHGPIGTNAFFLGPLYPYVLAGLRVLAGDSIHDVLVLQSLWGAAAVVLLADAARRLTQPWIGIVVGALALVYETSVFFDGLVLMESLLFFLESLLLWCVVRFAVPRASPRALAGLGAVIGLIAEGRATAVALLLPAWAFLVAPRGAPVRATLIRTAWLLGGFLAVVTPPAVRNLAVSGEWIPFTYNGGFNLYIGNHAEATGGFVRVTGTQVIGAALSAGSDGGVEADSREFLAKSTGVRMSPRASSAWWASRARAWIAGHPVTALGLALRKVGMMWNRREYPQIENLEEYRSVAGPLGVPGLGGFALLGPLALAGLVLAWPRGKRERFVMGYAIVMTLAVAPFFVTDRYRHHLVPAALLLAAIAIERSAGGFGRRGGVIPIVALLAAGVVVVNFPAPELSRRQYEWGLAFDLGTRWAEQGRPELAAAQYEKALRLEQEGRAGHVSAVDRGDLYYDYANALARMGRSAEAITWYQQAVSAAPDNALAVRALADACAAAGRIPAAESLYTALESKAGGQVLAWIGRARLAAAQGRLAEAEALFRRAADSAPSQVDGWAGLIQTQIQARRLADARSTLERARRSGLPLVYQRAYEALLAALTGDAAAARRALAEIPADATQGDPTLADVVRVTHGVLGGRK